MFSENWKFSLSAFIKYRQGATITKQSSTLLATHFFTNIQINKIILKLIVILSVKKLQLRSFLLITSLPVIRSWTSLLKPGSSFSNLRESITIWYPMIWLFGFPYLITLPCIAALAFTFLPVRYNLPFHLVSIYFCQLLHREGPRLATLTLDIFASLLNLRFDVRDHYINSSYTSIIFFWNKLFIFSCTFIIIREYQ
jgi:hypothetical protein